MTGSASYNTIIYKGGSPVTVTDASTTAQLSGTTVYRIDTAPGINRRVIDPDSEIVVEVDGVVAPSGTWKVKSHLNGEIQFDDDQDADAVVTVTYKYIPTAVLAQCTNKEISLTSNVIPSTTFDDNGNTSNTQGLLDVSITIERNDNFDKSVMDELKTRERFYIIISLAGGKEFVRGWFNIESDNFSGGLDDIENESISFKLDARTANTFNWDILEEI